MTRSSTAATADAARGLDYDDEGGADAAEAEKVPRSIVRSSMTCRVAVMEAAAENMPLDAPYGHVGSRVKAMNEKLAQVCTQEFPNGISASDTALCHPMTGIIAMELKAFATRNAGEQFVTGDNLGDANADLNAACQQAQIALDENTRFKKLSTAEKTKESERKAEAEKGATTAREAGDDGCARCTPWQPVQTQLHLLLAQQPRATPRWSKRARKQRSRTPRPARPWPLLKCNRTSSCQCS